MIRSFRFSRAAWFVLCACLSWQCRDDSTSTQPPPQYSAPVDLTGVIPLQVGNSWTYRTISTGISGSDTTIDSIRIVDSLWMNGVKYYRYLGAPPHLFTGSDSYLETVDRADYSMYMCLNCLDGAQDTGVVQWAPLHLLKTPLSKGHQWRVADWDSAQGGNFGTLTITNPDTSVQLDIRRFDHAICLTHTSETDHRTFFIVPGIGVIRLSIGSLDSWAVKDLIAWSVR